MRTFEVGETGATEPKTLKETYLECFGVRTNNTTALQDVVKTLITRGIARDVLVSWAVQAGYTRKHVASVLSRIFCALGLRERRAGGGRKPSPKALELMAHAHERYGEEEFLNILRAAWRAGKARIELESQAIETFPGGPEISPVAVPQLHSSIIAAQQLGPESGVRTEAISKHSFNITPQVRSKIHRK